MTEDTSKGKEARVTSFCTANSNQTRGKKKFTMRKVKHSNRLPRRFLRDIQKNSTTGGSVLRSWPWFDCKVRLDGLQHPYTTHIIL